ncbi:MAG: hypothetical protein ACI3VZ_03240 [Faecousia sp.]
MPESSSAERCSWCIPPPSGDDDTMGGNKKQSATNK